MANNSTLIEVKDRGWLNGFAPLWRKENHGLWGTGSWLVKILVWMAIVDGLLAVVAFSGTISTAQDNQARAQAEEPLEQTALTMYFLFASIIPACGVIIFGHEDLIDERKLGTAPWVLSKPVSRAAFLLSKLAANALGVLGTMVLVQGVAAYIIYKSATGISPSIPGFLAGMGLVFLFLIFFLALIMMLSTLFHSRGPVIGIPLIFISCSYLTAVVPWLSEVMPASMILGLDSGRPSLAAILAQGQPLPTVTPIISTVFLVILFATIALVRFEREEF